MNYFSVTVAHTYIQNTHTSYPLMLQIIHIFLKFSKLPNVKNQNLPYINNKLNLGALLTTYYDQIS